MSDGHRLLAAAALLAALSPATPATPAAAQVGVFPGFGGMVPLGSAYGSWPPPPVAHVVPPPGWAYPSYGYVPPPGPSQGYAALPTPYYGYIPPAAPGPGPAPAGTCRAGALSCPLRAPALPGDACTCRTSRGAAWGRVGD